MPELEYLESDVFRALELKEFPWWVRHHVKSHMDFNDQPISTSKKTGKYIRGVAIICSMCGKRYYNALYAMRQGLRDYVIPKTGFRLVCDDCKANIPDILKHTPKLKKKKKKNV
jgi:hypothetical protein